MNPSKQIGDYFSRRFPFFTIFSNTSYPELAFLCFCFSPQYLSTEQFLHSIRSTAGGR